MDNNETIVEKRLLAALKTDIQYLLLNQKSLP